MSAPGAVHAHLQQLLADLAVLSGFPRPLDLGGGLVPDLARTGPTGARMVGDAKASEGPGDTASQDRLAAYVRRIAASPGPAADHLLVACPSAHEAAAWTHVLTRLAHGSGLGVRARRVNRFADHEHVGRIVVTPVTTSTPALDEQPVAT